MRHLVGLALLSLTSAAIADMVVPSDKVESFVNIRTAPESGAEVISRLHRGNPRPYVATHPGWNEVELGEGATGFVSSDWSIIITDEEALAVAREALDKKPEAAAPEPAVKPAEAAVADAPDANPEEPAVEASTADAADETPDPQEEQVDEPEATAVVEESAPDPVEPPAVEEPAEPVLTATPVPGPPGPQGPPGPPGPPGADGDGSIKGTENFLVRFKKATVGGNSQIYDDGKRVGIGTAEPVQKLEVNGSIQIHDQTSALAGLMITQMEGETGYILHNQASTLTIGAGSVDRITIDRDGNVGFGVARPEYPIELPSGAHVSAGGVWTNSSSRARKENIASLTVEEALAALADLEPVEFNYRNEREEKYLGFIAEDVPDLVATDDRKSLSTMDIVAVLTRVVQEQQQRIDELEARLEVTSATD